MQNADAEPVLLARLFTDGHTLASDRLERLRRDRERDQCSLQTLRGGELKHLLAEYLLLDVRIDLARRPRRPDWRATSRSHFE